jgi:hypothetical protein
MATPLDKFTNSALTTLAAGLDNITNPATMVVASAVGFPTSGSYRVICGTELLQVTAGAGTTSWTVTRQVESTAIAAHAIGDAVVHVVTAFEINSLVQTFNVNAYLAKGDGATDDKTPFQNAVNDAHAITPGGWVFIPTAAYVIGSSLTTYSNVVFVTYGATFSGVGAASVAPLVNISLLGGLTLPALLTISTGGLTVSAGSIILPAASIADGALSGNVALKNINNSFSVGQTITGNSTITGTLGGVTTLTATTVVAAVTGNASTATALQTARAINGVNFDGTAPITVAAAAGTLTGGALAAGVLASSLTSTGILAALHMTSPVIDSGGLIVTAGTSTVNADLVLATAPRIVTTGTVPTVGSGGAGTSALSIIAGATNTAGQFQVTATTVVAGAVLGVVAFGGGPLATAPKVVLVTLAAPTGGVLTPIVPIADSYTTSGFTINAGNASTTATYIINYFCIF